MAASLSACGGTTAATDDSKDTQQTEPEEATKTETEEETDTAIYVISRISGESVDRWEKQGDYYISEQEEQEMKPLAALYPHLIVLLNVGGVMDLSFLEEIPVAALILMSRAGMEGGNALADLLPGKVNPSGRQMYSGRK